MRGRRGGGRLSPALGYSFWVPDSPEFLERAALSKAHCLHQTRMLRGGFCSVSPFVPFLDKKSHRVGPPKNLAPLIEINLGAPLLDFTHT